MKFRETNHLRKLANEQGKKMRGRKGRIDTRPALIPDRKPGPTPEPQASGESPETIAREQALSAMNIATQNAIGPAPEPHQPSPMNLGDFVNQTLRMWEAAAAKVAGEPEGEELKGNLQIASSVLRHTYSVYDLDRGPHGDYCAGFSYVRAEDAPAELPRGHNFAPSTAGQTESDGAAGATYPRPQVGTLDEKPHHSQDQEWAYDNSGFKRMPVEKVAEPEPPRGGADDYERLRLTYVKLLERTEAAETKLARIRMTCLEDDRQEKIAMAQNAQMASSPSPALGVQELAKVLRDAWNTGDKGTWVNVAKAALEALKPVGVLPSAEEWIRIEDRLPDEAQHVIVFDWIEGQLIAWNGYVRAERARVWHPALREDITLKRVTHWKPLPDPPVAALGQQEGE